MLQRLIIIAIFLAILYSLFSGMYFMIRDKGDSTRNVKSLTIRIGLSIFLFALLIGAYFLGWIQPNSIHP